jgi:hypothetical protein
MQGWVIISNSISEIHQNYKGKCVIISVDVQKTLDKNPRHFIDKKIHHKLGIEEDFLNLIRINT